MLKLNLSKCKSITIGNPKFKIPGTSTYSLNTEHGTHTLEDVTIEKDLGVLIDSELNFENHIYSKIRTANKMLAIIKRIKLWYVVILNTLKLSGIHTK